MAGPAIPILFAVESVISSIRDAKRQEERERELRQQAEQAEQRAEEERQSAEEEKQRVEEERRRAEEERQRAERERQSAEEERQRAEEERQSAEEERQRAEEKRQRAEEKRQRAEEKRQRAEEERQRAEKERQDRKALEQHMRDLGIDPADPNISPEDIEEAKRDINYDPDPNTVNIAVAGNANAGKSSLLNAIRNLSNDSPDWAPTGGSEVTRQRQRYPDPAHNCVWYDLSRVRTQSVTAFDYYYRQKLFAYDKIVLVHETTLTESDIRLLQVCEHFKQHCIVVRTKSDMHIFNYMKERRTPRRTPQQAREDFLSDVRQDVARFREQAEASRARFVPKFDDLVVSTAGVEAFVQGESSGDMVDEARFFRELERRDAPLGS